VLEERRVGRFAPERDPVERGLLDYKALQGAGCTQKGTVRTLNAVVVERRPYTLHPWVPLACGSEDGTRGAIEWERGGEGGRGAWDGVLEEVSVRVRANAFMQRMVRNLVGMLVSVGVVGVHV
jgi:hypothetical protein